MDLKEYLPKVSKAIAGALVTVIVSLLLKYNIQLTPEVNSALSVLVDAAVSGILGFVVVYLFPKNK